jgi:transposase-like protein
MSAMEIIGERERRRRWSVEAKLRIVGETHEPGACVRAVAARHDVYPSLLHYWRREVREGRLGNVEALRFVPVRVTEAPLSPSAVGAASVPKNRRGVAVGIEIVLPDGCRLLVSNEVSLTVLRRVVRALRG